MDTNLGVFRHQISLSPRVDDSSFDNPIGLKKLRSLILLTYYDDDNPVQTCEEKLLLSTLKGSMLNIRHRFFQNVLHSTLCHRQCDQMARLFAIYNNINLPNIIEQIPK